MDNHTYGAELLPKIMLFKQFQVGKDSQFP